MAWLIRSVPVFSNELTATGCSHIFSAYFYGENSPLLKTAPCDKKMSFVSAKIYKMTCKNRTNLPGFYKISGVICCDLFFESFFHFCKDEPYTGIY